MCATKRLARELGFVRKGATLLASSLKESSKVKSAPCEQIFSHVIVLDFEATCWQDRKITKPSEIIEFPAVLLNTKSGEVEAEFQSYVQPTEHPRLTPFCKQLTGITQEQVESAVTLETCLSMFDSWIQDLVMINKFVFSRELERSCRDLYPNICTFLTWSDWDLGRCLPAECRRKRIYYPHYLKQWIDLRSLYKTFYKRKPRGVCGSLQDLGMSFQGRQHSGIDDARNTALLAQRMMEDGCILEVTRSLLKGVPDDQSNSASKSTFHESYISSNLNPIAGYQERTVLADLDTSETNEPSKRNESVHQPVATEAFTSSHEISSVAVKSSNRDLDCKTTEDFFADDSALDKELTAALIDENTSPNAVLSSPGSDELVGHLGNTVAKPAEALSTLSSPAHLRAEEDTDTRLDEGPNCNSINSVRKRTLASAFESNENTNTVLTVTPPFCSCGRRAKRQRVQKVGPNHGRYFYSCGENYSYTLRKCSFFQWEAFQKKDNYNKVRKNVKQKTS